MNEHPKEPKAESSALQIRKIGNSIGLLLPKEMVARLNLKDGDKLFPVVQSDGALLLTPHDPDFEEAMTIARRGMKRYRNALAELAK